MDRLDYIQELIDEMPEVDKRLIMTTYFRIYNEQSSLRYYTGDDYFHKMTTKFLLVQDATRKELSDVIGE